jgi:hypothetical protein
MGGGGQSQNSTTKTEPWEGQQPYLTQGFEEADRIYQQGPQEYYPGQTYTNMSPFRQAGLFGAAGLAGQGNDVANNAAGYAANTLGGNSDNPWGGLLGTGASGMANTANGANLMGNPFLDQTYDQAAGKLTDNWSTNIMPGIAAQFGQSGGAGTTMHSELATRAGGELGDSLASLGNQIYGGNYQQERDRQVNAQGNLANLGANLYGTGVNERMNLANNAGAIRDAQFGDYDRLGDIGKSFEEQQGKVLEDDINRWNFMQNRDLANLQDYMAMVTGNYGSTSTSRTSGGGGSGLNSALGAAGLMASLFG